MATKKTAAGGRRRPRTEDEPAGVDVHVHVLGEDAQGPGPIVVGWLQGPPREGCFSGVGAGSEHPLTLELQRSTSSKRRAQRKLTARSDVAQYDALIAGGGAQRAFR